MRRFLIWSVLAVVVGLVLAVAGVLAYDRFYARFQPVTIARNQGQIQRLIDEASWVSKGGGDRPVYIVGYRDSAQTTAWLNEEAPALRAGGADVRILMFARPDRQGMARSTAAERATLAELWLTRDWGLYSRWAETPSEFWTAPGLPPADGDLARTAVVEASREFTARLDELMRDAGVKPTWPLILWRDREGFLKACACADRRSWAAIRADLIAPRPVEKDAPPPEPTPTPPSTEPEPPTAHPLPYPNLTYPARPAFPPSSPPADAPVTTAPPSVSRPAPIVRPSPPRQSTPARPQAAPSQSPPASSQARRPTPNARPAPPRPRPSLPQDSQFY